MSALITLSSEEGGKSESHTLALSAQYQLLKWIFIIIFIIISLMEQSELSNILCPPNYFFSPSGISTPFPLGISVSTPWS